MTNQNDRLSYKFGDAFGNAAETDSDRVHAPVEGSGYNQADCAFEEDDAIRAQGGAA